MRYVALLRGIGPGNPSMRNDKLRGVFEDLGFRDVATVVSSGNVVFDADSSDARALEARIEAAWPERLGFQSTTVVRTGRQLQRLVSADPFGDRQDVPASRFQVTFLKRPPRATVEVPCSPGEGGYTIVAITGRAVCSVVDTTSSRAPDLMRWLEKTYGTQITTRSWKTVQRIVATL